MPAKVILNPYAARWSARKRRPEVESALLIAGVEYDIEESQEPGHAIELAFQAVKNGFAPIVAAGGDGTINEVVNGMARAAGEYPLTPFGVMPLGTANDLMNNLGLAIDLERAAHAIASGKWRKMDLCQVNGRFFANNSGVGLEPYVTTIQEKMTAVHGIARYMLAALTGIAHNPQWSMSLEWDSGEYSGPVTMISIGNSPLTGGVFYTVPHADPFDGKLTFIYGYISSRTKILMALPKMLKSDSGNISEHPAIHEVHSTWLKVRVEPYSPSHADGELFDRKATDLKYRVFPGRLPILTG